jgi:hypothetical protein
VFAFLGCVGAVLFTILSGCNEFCVDGGGGALKHIQVSAYCEFLGCSMVLFPADTFQEIHVIGKRGVSGGGMILCGRRSILSPPASVWASNGKSGVGSIPPICLSGVRGQCCYPGSCPSTYHWDFFALSKSVR